MLWNVAQNDLLFEGHFKVASSQTNTKTQTLSKKRPENYTFRKKTQQRSNPTQLFIPH